MNNRGFTLIEALVAMALAAVLLSLAVPGFAGAMHKARRIEAIAALGELQLAQERARANSASYADAWSQLGMKNVTASAQYDLAIEDASTGGYTASATARAGSAQWHDTRCRVLRIALVHGSVTYSSVDADGRVDASGARCWGR